MPDSLNLAWAQRGICLSEVGFYSQVIWCLGCAILLATLIPIIGFLALRRSLPTFDAIALAASFGSVSAIGFIVATQRLEDAGIAFGGHMSATMAIMESPAIILAVAAAAFFRNKTGAEGGTLQIREVLHEALTDGTQLLLLGAMLIGFITAEAGKPILQPLFIDLFKCILALFLLDMGQQVARNLGKVSLGQKSALTYTLVTPLIHAGLALVCCQVFSIGAGDGVLLMTLAASSSFFAVQEVLRHAVPEANPTLYFGLALGLNCPLNLTLGIPLWINLSPRYLSP